MEPVFDPSVLPYPIEFIHSGVQCRYFGTENRLRRKFLEKHKDWWRPYEPKENGLDVSRRSIEKVAQVGTPAIEPHNEKSSHDVRQSPGSGRLH